MIYDVGTVSVAYGSQRVLGDGTRWLSQVRPGWLLSLGTGVYYQVASVVSDQELWLSDKVGATSGTGQDLAALEYCPVLQQAASVTGAPYQLFADFTLVYSLPFPAAGEVNKIDTVSRLMRRLDELLALIAERLGLAECPPLVVLPMDMLSEAGDVVMNQPPVIVTADAVSLASSSVISADGAGAESLGSGLSTVPEAMDPSITAVAIVLSGEGDLTLSIGTTDMTPAATTTAASVSLVTSDSSSRRADAADVSADGLAGSVPVPPGLTMAPAAADMTPATTTVSAALGSDTLTLSPDNSDMTPSVCAP